MGCVYGIGGWYFFLGFFIRMFFFIDEKIRRRKDKWGV